MITMVNGYRLTYRKWHWCSCRNCSSVTCWL